MGLVGNIGIGMYVSTTGVTSGLRKGKAEIASFTDEVQSIASRLTGLYAGAMAGRGVAGFFVDSAKAASDLNEQVSATGVMFADAQEIVLAGAQEMADKFGTLKSSFLEAANSLAPLLDGMGKTKAQSATLAVQVLKMADDLSSIRNVPFAEALAAIRSGLVGEAEPLRRFGVLLNEAAVEQEAFRKGLAHSKADLTEQAKAEARLSLITRGLSYAQGDHGRTASSAANAAREAWGRWENTMAEFGKTLEPVTAGLLNLANVGVKGLSAELQANQGFLTDFFAGLGNGLKQATSDAGELAPVWGLLKDVIATTWDLMEASFRTGHGLATQFSAGLIEMMKPWARFTDMVTGSNWAESIDLTLEGMHRYINEDIRDVKGLFGAIDDGSQSAAKSMQAVGNAVQGVGQQVAAAAQQVQKFGGAADGIVGAGDSSGKDSGTLASAKDLARTWGQQSATLGMSERMASVTKLKNQNWEGEDLGPLEGLAKSLDEFDKFKEKMDDLAAGAKQLVESVATPMEKLDQERRRIADMERLGLIDRTTAARGILQAQKDSGLGKVEYAGAMEYGSQEARSTLLKAQGMSESNGPLEDLARTSRDTLQAQQQQAAAIERINAMMRQFLGTQMPTTARL